MTEPIDPEWLLEWSLDQKVKQRASGGYYFGPMYRLKEVDVICDEDSVHVMTAMGGCLDAPAISTRTDITTSRVQVYDADGNYLREETYDIDANEGGNQADEEAA